MSILNHVLEHNLEEYLLHENELTLAEKIVVMLVHEDDYVSSSAKEYIELGILIGEISKEEFSKENIAAAEYVKLLPDVRRVESNQTNEFLGN